MPVDPRIPVRFGSPAEATTGCALLIEGEQAAPPDVAAASFVPGPVVGHPVGCACCQPRRPAADALARLFLAHVRGEGAPFTGVLVLAQTSAGRRAVIEALNTDVLTRARFRRAERSK